MTRKLNLVAVGNGAIALSNRPKKSAITQLREDGFTHVVTVLGNKEGAVEMAGLVEQNGLCSIRVPLANGTPPTKRADIAMIANRLREIKRALHDGATILIHCSAGIHRTGMITNALLLSMGYTPEQSAELLQELRSHTAEGVGEHRLAWGAEFARMVKI